MTAFPTGYGSLLLTTMFLIVIAEIVLQIVLVIGSGSASEATAHEKMAGLKARRNAYGVLAFGVMAAIGSVFLEETNPVFYRQPGYPRVCFCRNCAVRFPAFLCTKLKWIADLPNLTLKKVFAWKVSPQYRYSLGNSLF